MTVVREDKIGQILHGIAELGALEYTWHAFLGVMVPANTAKAFIAHSYICGRCTVHCMRHVEIRKCGAY